MLYIQIPGHQFFNLVFRTIYRMDLIELSPKGIGIYTKSCIFTEYSTGKHVTGKTGRAI